MANRPPKNAKKPRAATVRGFLNLSLPVPETEAERQKEFSFGESAGLSYGSGNTVPVIAMAAAQQSGTAYRCLERRAQFLEGMGFPVPERTEAGQLVNPAESGTMGDMPVPGHPGKTANDLWAELCSYGAYLNGDAVLVRYNNGSTIGEIHVLPFGSVRKTANGTYLLNHRFGRKGYKANDTTEHLPFDDSKKTVLELLRRAKEINPQTQKPYGQPGQILYIYTPKAGEEDYPLPPHWPGLEAVLADAAYARYDLEEVEGGFTAKGILVLKGAPNDSVPGQEGYTEAEEEVLEMKTFTNAGARAQGVRRKSILVMNAETEESVPEWIPMNTTVDLKWLSDKKEAIGQEVCRHIGIPPILAGFARAGQLGATQEIINATQLTQNSLESLRKVLLRGFWRLMPALSGVVPGKLSPLVVAAEITGSTPAQP